MIGYFLQHHRPTLTPLQLPLLILHIDQNRSDSNHTLIGIDIRHDQPHQIKKQILNSLIKHILQTSHHRISHHQHMPHEILHHLRIWNKIINIQTVTVVTQHLLVVFLVGTTLVYLLLLYW